MADGGYLLTTNGSVTFLDLATSALEHGLKVIPLRPGQKVPFFDDWVQLATRDLSKVQSWAKSWPTANCGVVTDSDESLGTWILDVDSVEWFINSYPLEQLPQTLAVKTGGGGLQFHFKHDGNSRAKLRNLAVKNPHKGEDGQKETLVEVLATHRQGVFAGSLHPSGRHYEYLQDLPVSTADPKLVSWLVELASPRPDKPNQRYLNPLRPDLDIEETLKQAGLKSQRLVRDGKVYLNYHVMMGKCLVSGSLHEAPNNRSNNNCCAFVLNPASRELWHQCFDCGPTPGSTKLALAALGLELGGLVDHGMPVAEALKSFSARGQLDQTPLEFIVDGFMPSEAISAIAGLSGHGKTWLSLSLAKALVKGGTLWDTFTVTRRCPVLYLVPEVGDRSLKQRLDIFSPGNDTWADDPAWFAARTFSPGHMLSLDSPEVQAVARGRVVFLDTTIRFIEGEENSSSDNKKGLADSVLNLLSQAKARAVVLLHHSPKAFRNEQEMYLENVLRGTGDIGAMLAAAYGVRLLDPAEKGLMHVECLKPRDFEGPKPFQLGLRPFLNDTGDVGLVGRPGDVGPLREHQGKPGPKTKQTPEQKQLVLKLHQEGKSVREIQAETGVSRSTVSRVINEELM